MWLAARVFRLGSIWSGSYTIISLYMPYYSIAAVTTIVVVVV